MMKTAILVVALILFLDLALCSSKSPKRSKLDKIPILKGKGKTFYDSKKYKQASYYYSAILQIIEGAGGEDNRVLRRTCGLSLAECQIKIGNLHEAIARCSEVIDEFPVLPSKEIDTSVGRNATESEEFSSEEETSEVTTSSDEIEELGKALYMRGMSLKLLNKPFLALIDFNTSLIYLPTSQKLSEEIETIESDNVSQLEIFYEEQTQFEEELQDVVEECLANFPTLVFNRKQIKTLIKASTVPKKSLIQRPGGAGGLGDILGGLGGLGGKGGDVPGGLGALGGLAGMLGGGGLGASGIATLLELTGMDPKRAETVSKVIKAGMQTFQFASKVSKFMKRHKELIIISLTCLWLFFGVIKPTFLTTV